MTDLGRIRRDWRLEVDLEIEYDWRRRLKNVTAAAPKSWSMTSLTYGRSSQRPLRWIFDDFIDIAIVLRIN